MTVEEGVGVSIPNKNVRSALRSIKWVYRIE